MPWRPVAAAQSDDGPSPGHTIHIADFADRVTNAQFHGPLQKKASFLWASDSLFCRAGSVWLKALEQFRPDILQATGQAWKNRSTDANPATPFVRPGRAEFLSVPSDSIDYAVMERCPGSRFPIKMIALNAGWSDLGAWDAVWNVLPKDEENNACVGDVLTTHSSNNLVHATGRLVALVGVSNLIVVETPDAVLVADKHNSQDVKHNILKFTLPATAAWWVRPSFASYLGAVIQQTESSLAITRSWISPAKLLCAIFSRRKSQSRFIWPRPR